MTEGNWVHNGNKNKRMSMVCWYVNGLLGFPGGSDGEESTHSVKDLGLIPGLGRSPGGGPGNPL